MISFATLSGPVPKLGVVAIALLAAAVLLVNDRRANAAAMLGALVLAPVLLLAEVWHSPQLSIVHRHPLFAVVGALLLMGAVGVGAAAMLRWPSLLAFLTVIALPFRIPVQSGGTTSNLLVPLYFVVAAGAVASIVAVLHPRWGGAWRRTQARPGWVQRLLALYIVFYGLQAVYSSDFEKALQNMVFFYVPFTLLFELLSHVSWSKRMLRACLQIVAVMAIVFVCIAFVEYATRTIFLNSKLVVQNDLHTYFVVNSVFFDPDIFGRFLVLVMVLLAATLLYDRTRREHLTVVAILAMLWCGLVLTLSRSSLAALLVGLGTLVAVRFGLWRQVLAAGAAVVVIGAAAVAISPTTFGLNQGLNGASSGRGNLLSGGIRLFADRPVWGFGSGSFQTAYHAHNPASGPLTASHTIAVTIAAEQGLIGEIAYVALVVVAVTVLIRGAGADPARAAIGAAFIALVLHTELYADFLEDPFTWVLLGIGVALAGQPTPKMVGPPEPEHPAVAA
jgi:putative inorganic carbon (HCO3(-)) transporter